MHRTIHAYVHDGRIGVLVEVATETDFAARTDEFRAFCRDVAMHVAASAPADVAELLAQSFVKDRDVRVDDRLAAIAALLRERVAIVRCVRWTVSDDDVPAEPEPPKRPAVIARRA